VPAPNRKAKSAYRDNSGCNDEAGPDSRLVILTAYASRLCAAPAGSIALGSVQRSSPLVEIAAALAAELGFLTAALDEPGADVADSLHRLTAGATIRNMNFWV
jgi:hypothetical protein